MARGPLPESQLVMAPATGRLTRTTTSPERHQQSRRNGSRSPWSRRGAVAPDTTTVTGMPCSMRMTPSSGRSSPGFGAAR